MATPSVSACIGIDIGGTNLRSALVDSDGVIVESERCQTAIHLGKDNFLERLLSAISGLRKRGEILGEEVRAIGMGIPGLIDGSGLVLSSVNLEPCLRCSCPEGKDSQGRTRGWRRHPRRLCAGAGNLSFGFKG